MYELLFSQSLGLVSAVLVRKNGCGHNERVKAVPLTEH